MGVSQSQNNSRSPQEKENKILLRKLTLLKFRAENRDAKSCQSLHKELNDVVEEYRRICSVWEKKSTFSIIEIHRMVDDDIAKSKIWLKIQSIDFELKKKNPLIANQNLLKSIDNPLDNLNPAHEGLRQIHLDEFANQLEVIAKVSGRLSKSLEREM